MEIRDKLSEFEFQIRDVISRFKTSFGDTTPNHLWRSGRIERTGFLDADKRIEYSFHGAGCTVDLNGKIVSFDFDLGGQFCYTAFKFFLFLNDEAVDENDLSKAFVELVEQGTMTHIPNRGVRLTQ